VPASHSTDAMLIRSLLIDTVVTDTKNSVLAPVSVLTTHIITTHCTSSRIIIIIVIIISIAAAKYCKKNVQ